MKLLSVIVPVYNTEKYVKRCVESIQKQTYKNIEILLINDGSTDSSGLLCEEIAILDKRVRVFHKLNGGSSSARNLGIDKADGDYLAFVDSDDYVENTMYEQLMEGIERTEISIVQIGRIEETEEGGRLADVCEIPDKEMVYSSHDFLRELLMYRGDSSFCTKVIKKELFHNRKFPEGELNEDLRLLVEFLEQGTYVLSLPAAGYHVVYRMGSNTRKTEKNTFSRAYLDAVRNADRIMELVTKKYKNLEEEARRFGAYQRLLYMLHIPVTQMKKENKDYMEILRYIRVQRKSIARNPYLSKKDKTYLFILSTSPRVVRWIHKKIRRI